MVCCATASAFAQTNVDKHTVVTNKFKDNWFISAGGGAQMYFGDSDAKQSFGKRIAPVVDVSVGKWFTPVIGARLTYSGLQAKGATLFSTGHHSTGKMFRDGYYSQKWDMMHLHGELMLNLSDLFCGYKEDRVYSVIPYAGVGWMRAWSRPKTDEIAGTVGLINRFRLSSALDLNVEARGTLVKDGFDSEIGGIFKEGLAAVTVGLTYKFKQRGWKYATVAPSVSMTQGEIDEMQRKMRDLNDQNAKLQNELTAEHNKPKSTTIVEKQVSLVPSITVFPIGKSELSKADRVNLGFMAKAMKETKKSYTLCGYADKATGSAQTNEKLSKARAQAVYDVLTKEYGVDPSQLTIDYKGGVDNMFYNDTDLSRVVIVGNER